VNTSDKEKIQKVNTDQPVQMDAPAPVEERQYVVGEDFDRDIPHEQAFHYGWSEPQNSGMPTDISHRANILPFDQLHPMTWSEDRILRDVVRHTKVAGIQNHHPEIAKVVLQSFEEHPELQVAYLQS
jgi:hypothetical protein